MRIYFYGFILIKDKRTVMRIIRLLTMLLLFTVTLTSCSKSGFYELEPIGIGKDPSELKKSPCACIKLENGTKFNFSVSDFS
jgi:hypothetical protein